MNPSLAFHSPEAIRNEQECLLRKQIEYVAAHSPFYKKIFSDNQIDPRTIQSLEDLKRIPTTSKDDFANNNELFLAVSNRQIIDWCTTSGTTGNPVMVGLTENDLQRLAHNEYLSFLTAELEQNDCVQLMLTLDKQFMAGMAYYLGLRKIGCGIVRSGPGTPAAQIDIIKRHKVNVLVAVPSFLLKIISFAQGTGIDLNSLGVEKIICIGEAVRNDDLSPNILATKITDHWNVKLYGTFASTEMQTAFTEDVHGDGYFLQPELLHAEILDDNNNEVAEGETGELTITHFGLEGTPLIRYRTGDICRKLSSQSKSGRNTLKIGPVIGRKNQLIKLNGTTLYPNAIIQTLKEYDLDDFLVVVEKSAVQTDEVKILITSSKAVNYELMIQQLQNRLRVKPVIIHATKSELDALRPRDSRKLIQVIFR